MVKSYFPYLALMTARGFGQADCLNLPSDFEETFLMMKSPGGRRLLSGLLGKNLDEIRWDEFDKQLEAIERHSAGVVSISDEDYPSYLRDIPESPPVLFYRGDLRCLDTRGISMVGTRKPSAKGAAFARGLARGLAGAGIMVASGLARGIDSAVHEGTLEGVGPAVGVMGTGLDVPYPSENAVLMGNIASKGCLFTEQFMGTGPSRHVFPRRNRLISAVSHAVVVVEAGEKSGALITARWAVEQGREVGAVPGFPVDFRSTGVNSLIRDGAFLVESIEDIFAAVPLLRQGITRSREAPGGRGKLPQDLDTGAEDSIMGYSEDVIKRIMLSLSSQPVDPDTLASQVRMDVAEVGRLLTALEVQGKVAADQMGCYYRL